MDNYNEGAIDNQIRIIKNLVNGLKTTMNQFIFTKSRGDEVANHVETIMYALDCMKVIVYAENCVDTKVDENPKSDCKTTSINPDTSVKPVNTDVSTIKILPETQCQKRQCKTYCKNDLEQSKEKCEDYTRSEIISKIRNLFNEPFMFIRLQRCATGYLVKIYNRSTNRIIYNFNILYDANLDNSIKMSFDIYNKLIKDDNKPQNKSVKRFSNDIAESETEDPIYNYNEKQDKTANNNEIVTLSKPSLTSLKHLSEMSENKFSNKSVKSHETSDTKDTKDTKTFVDIYDNKLQIPVFDEEDYFSKDLNKDLNKDINKDLGNDLKYLLRLKHMLIPERNSQNDLRSDSQRNSRIAEQMSAKDTDKSKLNVSLTADELIDLVSDLLNL